jgi:4a-hydroxytetrahydrobiopterin dehydratase
MSKEQSDATAALTRRQVSDAVGELGWRYILGLVRTAVPVASLTHGAEVAARVAAAAGADASECLWMDVRPDAVILTVQTVAVAAVTARDIEVVRRISETLHHVGLLADPGLGARASRSMQVLELAIDALDIASVRPFWKAVTGYADEADRSGPEDPLVDPLGQGPAIWFQQMDAPRPQRNRIHVDISVPHDEASRRLRAALDAGGRLVSDARAPAFWVLADREGNEACITTWQGRDG